MIKNKSILFNRENLGDCLAIALNKNPQDILMEIREST